MGVPLVPRPPDSRPQVIRFGTYEVDFRTGELRSNGLRVKLQEQPFQVLQVLLENPGALVTHDQLRARIWPGNTYVEFDQGLYSAIKRLRSALDDSAERPRYIETLSRRGYRFIAPAIAAESAMTLDDAPLSTIQLTLRRWNLPPLLPEVLAGFAGALLLIGVLAAFNFRAWREALLNSSGSPTGQANPTRTFVMPPEGSAFAMAGDQSGAVVISPDGRKLAFAAGSAIHRRQLWVRSLDGLSAQAIAGTENASFPFWSPDGLALGFFADGKLKRVDLPAGTVTTLSEAPTSRGASWSRRGVILFAPTYQGGIFQIAADGGQAKAVTALDPATGETSHRFPHILPDGRHFVYLGGDNSVQAGEQTAIYFASLDGEKPRFLVRADSDAVYASGYLLYMRGNTLLAHSFDPDRGKLSGDPKATVEQVAYDAATWKGVLSASQTGTLVYQLAGGLPATDMVWLDRRGKSLGAFGLRGEQFSMRISADGKRLGTTVERNATTDIWVYDLADGVRQRMTWDAADHDDVVWSPDGTRIAFAKMLGRGHYKIYERALAAAPGSERLLWETADDVWPDDWSVDGRFLLFNRGNHEAQGGSVWVLPLAPSGNPFRVFDPSIRSQEVRFSPDAKWISFHACHGNACEVFLAPFRGTAISTKELVQVSHGSGSEPHWHGSRELLYISHDREMMAASIGDRGVLSPARPLFHIGFQLPRYTSFDVTPDGQRFIINRVDERSAPIAVVTNWYSGLRR